MATVYTIAIITGLVLVAVLALAPLFLVLYLGEFLLNAVPFGRSVRFLLIMLKSLRRNLLRTSLTYLAAFVLVVVITLVWSQLYFLDKLTAEKTRDLKVIVTEKWQAGSQMPWAYARPLSEGAADRRRPYDVRPQDSMTWQFYIGTLDAAKKTRENLVFFIALEPRKILTMMDALLDEFTPAGEEHRKRPSAEEIARLQEAVRQMERNKRAVILGKERLKAINKQVGERFSVTGINYSGIDLEFEVVGVFPDSRYNDNAVMNCAYLNDALDAYPKTHGGARHPLADKSLNMVWLQVPDPPTFLRLAEQIDTSGLFDNPAVKCETLSSGVATWIEGYRDLIWGIRWLLAPALLATMALVIANAISISVRERRTELAVLKVLGYRPAQILTLVLGEAVLIGAISGLLSAGLTYLAIDYALPQTGQAGLYVPVSGLVWGPAIGALTALAGSLLPAWAACKVQVSEVFAKIA